MAPETLSPTLVLRRGAAVVATGVRRVPKPRLVVRGVAVALVVRVLLPNRRCERVGFAPTARVPRSFLPVPVAGCSTVVVVVVTVVPPAVWRALDLPKAIVGEDCLLLKLLKGLRALGFCKFCWMESISTCFGVKFGHPTKNSHDSRRIRCVGIVGLGGFATKRFKRTSCAAVVGDREIDLANSDWKIGFEEDFERRFYIPHLSDVFGDLSPMPSTFNLKSRRPPYESGNGCPYERWNGYINNNDRVLLKVIKFSSPLSAGAECIDPDCTWIEQWVHRAGPREEIYFRPEEVNAAIVTCGGLCPGLNDVIRQIVITLEIYGVKNIVGIPFGYRGFSAEKLPKIPLSRSVVQNIHLDGGSLLGVSRGGPNVSEIVDNMQERGIDMLFVLGGNGTHAGANEIHNECWKRGMRVAVVGVPKTIDNDILWMDKTFGFDTAVEEAQRAINSAYIEAHSAYNGIGIVKLMGRNSGFIAMHASLSSGQVDVCLIPEVPFELHGPHGVLRHLQYLIETKGSAVVCVAEGAGQNLVMKTNAKDQSGNVVLGDIGAHIQKETKKYFKDIGTSADVKYIDPTYMIRACRANASDGILCTVLGQNAVHGAFAGYSGITVGICNTHYVYLPIPEVISYPKNVDPNSRMWHRCLTSTGQPDFF